MSKNGKISSLDKAILQAMGENRHVGRDDDEARKRWPELWEWMSTIYVGKDNIKQPSQLTISLAPDGVVARLVDKDMKMSVNVSCSSLVNVFDAIEAALTSQNIPVTMWGKGEPQLRKRRIRS